MTDERVEPTKASLDALIDQIDESNFKNRWAWNARDSGIKAMMLLRDAILASQPERVETRTKPLLDVIDLDDEQEAYNHFRDVIHGAGDPSQPERVECDEENHRYFREDNGYKFCPECGQSLKGVGND